MPIPVKYQAVFVEDGIYHVYNRSCNKEKLFLDDANRSFFLKQYAKYISPVADTFCWCLLPNHFHFLIRIKKAAEISALLAKKASGLSNTANPAALHTTAFRFLKAEITLDQFTEFCFKSLFQSYSQAFNKVNKRKGNLFYKPFKRTAVIKDAHFTQAIIYIHANPQRHHFCKDFSQWRWSSWNSFISEAATQLKRDEVLDWFGGKERFIKTHREMAASYYSSDISNED